MKFRGKCAKGEHKGEWIYGGVCSWLAVNKLGKTKHRACIVENNLRLTAVRPETIGQSLYLQDANGNDIYEGDIVLRNNQKFKVMWCRERATFALQSLDGLLFFNWTSLPVVVIGNIIDTPTLL